MRVASGWALLALFLLSPAARAAVVEEFKAEDWDGLAFTSDETGQFTHCSVYASYRNGSTLYISYEVGDSWFFSVANDSWNLTEGGSFAIRFRVDRRGEIEGTGTALAATQIGLPVERDHPFVRQLRRGNQLVISFQDKDYAFELSNSNRAMNAASDCVHRHVQLGTNTPIMSSNPEEPPPTQESGQAQQQPATPAPDRRRKRRGSSNRRHQHRIRWRRRQGSSSRRHQRQTRRRRRRWSRRHQRRTRRRKRQGSSRSLGHGPSRPPKTRTASS